MFRFFNVFFRYLLIFLAVFVWIRFFVSNLTLALLYTSLIAIIIEVLINFLLSRKLAKKTLKKNECLKIEKYFQSLILSSKKEVVDFFYSLAKKRFQAKKLSSFVSVIHDEGSTILFPIFKYSLLEKQDIVEIISKTKDLKKKKVVVCCYEANKKACEFAKKFSEFDILVLEKEDVYLKLFVEYDCFPNVSQEVVVSKKTDWKTFLDIVFSRDKTKGYFFSSLVVLFSSLIVRQSVYYVVMSSILLALALVSFILPLYRKKIPEQIL